MPAVSAVSAASSAILPDLEICVDCPRGLHAAVEGGADRVELCAGLSLGGLTPGAGLMALAAKCGVPCHAMIRPRPGDFVVRPGDLEAMHADIAAARTAGLAGVVIGAAEPDGRLDTEALAALVSAAAGLEVTLHRVFDLVPDAMAAVDAAIALGLDRILTSGQAGTAPQGARLLTALAARAGGRIQIMAGGGVGPMDVPALIDAGVDAIHASASRSDTVQTDCTRIGIGTPRVTDTATVAALRTAILNHSRDLTHSNEKALSA